MLLGVFGALVLYCTLLAAPSALFPHALEAAGVTLRATQPFEEAEARRVLARASALVAESELGPLEGRPRVFLTESRAHFAVFSHRAYRSLAVSYAAFGAIYLSPTDLANDRVTSGRRPVRQRAASAVVAHELVHLRLRERLGVMGARALPRWKREGIAEFVAGSSSLDPEEGAAFLRSGSSGPGPAFTYFVDRALIAYLVRVRGLTLDEILVTPLERGEVLEEVRAFLATAGSLEDLFGPGGGPADETPS